MMLAKLGGGMWAASPGPDEPEEEPVTFLKRLGHVPLPPYIRDGEMAPEDVETYQTVFARKPGAVAAPTAGLHFTKELLKKLKEQGIEQTNLTLHVGIGTFRPMNVEKLEDHVMHEEICIVPRDTCAAIQAAKIGGGRIVAVGTTVTRSLETASLEGELRPFKGPTDLFIRPPFEFRTVDVLLTNFHLPRSTLLVLVRTFGGDELIKRAYEEAIKEKYRFYSYGDAMLIV
jgi:S-adenosylmethionine:tRNA ribosyltransferase-isomerase